MNSKIKIMFFSKYTNDYIFSIRNLIYQKKSIAILKNMIFVYLVRDTPSAPEPQDVLLIHS